MTARRTNGAARKDVHPKRTISKVAAKRAAKAAQAAFAKRDAKLPATWQRGGREWSKVLGHFGSSSA